MNNLLSVRDAQARILSEFQPVNTEKIAITDSAGRILGEDIQAPGDLPPFANSSMDGFAVRAEDINSASANAPVYLEIIADIPAGAMPDVTVGCQQAARIMTGAPLPPGADAVVPVEDTDFGSDQFAPAPGRVAVMAAVSAGQYVRPKGQDIRQGQTLLQKGRRLQPQDVGLLASIGQGEVCVFRRPRIALFSSGDELVQPGQPLEAGKIYDSNQYMLQALLEREGAQVIRLGTARDDPHQVYEVLSRSLEHHVDLIVTSAGVSVGAFDYVRQVIEAHGTLGFWRVNMRPGKPLAFGSFANIPLIGLPGNPVSAYVGCRVFVIPVVRHLSGQNEIPQQRIKAVLTHPVESDGRESYLRAVVTEEAGKIIATLTGHQGSGNLYSLVQANALLIVPSGVKSLPSGSEVEIWRIDRE